MYSVSIYRETSQVAQFTGRDAKEAWKVATQYVRGVLHAEGDTSLPRWYRSGPRDVFQMGCYRALSTLAVRA